jgi:RNA polymerase primary sigma factor
VLDAHSVRVFKPVGSLLDGFCRKRQGRNPQMTTRSCGSNRVRSRHRTTSCPKSLARIRDWIEREIPLIPHPLFPLRDAGAKIESLRPSTLDASPIQTKSEPGLAFVAGMVEAPLLTVDEERFLFAQMNYFKFLAEKNRRRLSLNRPDVALLDQVEEDLRRANAVRNRIVQSNLRLVVALAKKLSSSLDQLSELVSEGTLPLIRAVQLFDFSRGHRFSTYATWAVRNQLFRSIKRRRDVGQAINPDDDRWLNDLTAPATNPEDEEREAAERSKAVGELLIVLTDREREIVSARFGLDGQPTHQSLQEIATKLGLSKERVRQVVIRAIEKMQAVAKNTELS